MLQSDDEREHASRLIEIQILRGGRVNVPSIAIAPECRQWKTMDQLLDGALQMELNNLHSLQILHGIAVDNKDTVLEDQIASDFLVDQVC